MYNCQHLCTDAQDLESHYSNKHDNLVKLGLTLKVGGERQGVEAVIKDTLLSQVILFAISNKSQVKRFQIDHDNQVYEDALKRVAK